MLIDCDTCAVRGPACGGCVVTVLLGAPPAAVVDAAGTPALDLDRAEQAAIAVLAGSGLVPPLRLVPGDDVRGHREERPGPVVRRAPRRSGRRAAEAG